MYHHRVDRGRMTLALADHSGLEIGIDKRAGDCARFLFETSQPVRVLGQRFGEHLDGDVAAEPSVASAVHFAHAARTERSKNFVWTELRTRHQSHCVRANYSVNVVLRRVRRFWLNCRQTGSYPETGSWELPESLFTTRQKSTRYSRTPGF